MKRVLLLSVMVVSLAACAPQAEIDPPAPRVGKTISVDAPEARTAIVVDGRQLRKNVRFRGDACGKDSFDIQMTDAFERPIKQTLATSFSDATVVDTSMDLFELRRSRYDRLLVVKGKAIGSGFDMDKGLFTADIETTIAAGGLVKVLKEDGTVASEGLYGPATRDHEAGIACSGAVKAVRAASRGAVRKLITKSLNTIQHNREIRRQLSRR